MNVNFLLNSDRMFIQNNEYITCFFDEEVLKPEYDCYNPLDNCYWNNNVIFTTRDILDIIVGISILKK